MKRHARRLFKECPHPDDKQRLKLSQELGLKPRQVKFWFQNRRTQMKVRSTHAQISQSIHGHGRCVSIELLLRI